MAIIHVIKYLLLNFITIMNQIQPYMYFITDNNKGV